MWKKTLILAAAAVLLAGGAPAVTQAAGTAAAQEYAAAAEQVRGIYTPYEGAKYSLQYSVNNDQITITGIQSSGSESISDIDLGKLVIPEEIDGVAVTAIGNRAFCYYGFTGNLVIPDSVTAIGVQAFDNCHGLTGNLVIPDSVTSIGDYAFRDCRGFTGNLVIPNSVTSIGSNTFMYCGGFTGNLVIPDSVTSIGDHAFGHCRGFTGELIIPDSVKTIGDGAFDSCSGFTGDLIIPNSVTAIGEEAFFQCRGFSGDLVIPDSVKTIGDRAFYICDGFTGNLVISATTIGEYAFYSCDGFTGNLVIPDSVKTIGDHAFRNCSGFTGDLVISATTIGDYAFLGCGFTGNLVISDSVETIGDYAFNSCSGFTGNLVIPDSVKTIGDQAFVGCSGFTGNLVIPASVTAIGDHAFSSEREIWTSVTFLGKNTRIGYRIVFYKTPIYGYTGSTAEAYAEQYVYTFIPLTNGGDSSPTPTPTPPQADDETSSSPTPTPTPPQADDETSAQVQSFVARMYNVALGRDYETGGFNDWCTQLLTHEADGAGIARGFFLSDEFLKKDLNNEDFVDTLYHTFFDREPDEGGRQNWLNALADNPSRTYVLAGFVNSSEFDDLCERYGIARGTLREDGSAFNPGIRLFVERMYTKALNRDGEKAGIDDWVNRLITGAETPEIVAKNFFLSKELVEQKLSNQEYVLRLYRTFLDREPDEGGWQDWTGKLDNNELDREQVLEGFSRSEEFGKILENYGL